MHIYKGLALAKKFYLLILVPVLFDLLQLKDVLSRIQDFSIKFTIPSAIPSITQVLSNPAQGSGGGLEVNLLNNGLSGSWLLLFIALIVVQALFKGGFLGCIYYALEGEVVNVDSFRFNCRKYFTRFLLQGILVLLCLLIIMPLALMFGFFGILLLVGLFCILFYLIFWDYVLVVEDLSVISAAKRSLEIGKGKLKKVLGFLVPIVAVTGLLSVVANFLVAASPILAVLAIIAYGYFSTVVIFGMMSFSLDLLALNQE